MEDIRIVQHGRNSFEIIQGNKTSEELGYDEALGLLASLMMPENRPCLHWMKTKEEHQKRRDMFTKEVEE